MAASLLEHVRDARIPVELQVAGDCIDVWKGRWIVVERGRVVPDVQMLRHVAPAANVVYERQVLRIAVSDYRIPEVAFYRAEADHHVVAGTHLPGRLATVFVGERLHKLVREFTLHRFGHGIDEPENRSRRRPLFLVYGRAIRTLAVFPVVVLRDPVDLKPRVCPYFGQNVRSHYPQDVGIREAQLLVELDVAGVAPVAVVQRIIFRMVLPVRRARTQLGKRMAQAQVARNRAGGRNYALHPQHTLSVHAPSQGERRVVPQFPP